MKKKHTEEEISNAVQKALAWNGQEYDREIRAREQGEEYKPKYKKYQEFLNEMVNTKIQVNKKNEVSQGNMRVEALKKLGVKELPKSAIKRVK
jgi:hypothetical protein